MDVSLVFRKSNERRFDRYRLLVAILKEAFWIEIASYCLRLNQRIFNHIFIVCECEDLKLKVGLFWKLGSLNIKICNIRTHLVFWILNF